MTVVVITGASRGMGAAVTVRLAELGFTVVAAARKPEGLVQKLADLSDSDRPLDVHAVALDVRDARSVTAAAAVIEADFGVVDVLVNNAGIPGSWGPPAEVGIDDLSSVFDTNVYGPVRVTRAFLPLLARSARARLVMVSSGMGSFARQTSDPAYAQIAHLPYPAAKAALNMLTVQYAKSLPEVIVTAVDPGLTATEFTGGQGHSVDEGAEAIIAAAMDENGPSGRFMDRTGPAPW